VREMSRAEIMASMSEKEALKLVMKRVHDPSLASLIQETSAASHADQLKGALRGAQNKSSGAFEDAINKLNEMTEEAQQQT